MRDIKFRAWHKTGEAMMPDLKNVYTLNSAFQDDTLIFMQYTGFHDCHGMKVYEGDVLTIWIQGDKQINPYVVEDMFRLYSDYNHDDMYYQITKMEVIGNIHENRELLEQK